MTEMDLKEKLFAAKEAINSYVIGYNRYADAQKGISDGKITTIEVETITIDVPRDLVYMCAAVIDRKQSMLLDLISERCAEMTKTIEKYKAEQEKDMM